MNKFATSILHIHIVRNSHIIIGTLSDSENQKYKLKKFLLFHLWDTSHLCSSRESFAMFFSLRAARNFRGCNYIIVVRKSHVVIDLPITQSNKRCKQIKLWKFWFFGYLRAFHIARSFHDSCLSLRAMRQFRDCKCVISIAKYDGTNFNMMPVHPDYFFHSYAKSSFTNQILMTYRNINTDLQGSISFYDLYSYLCIGIIRIIT